MKRNFEDRKPTKVYSKSKENQSIIKALNMYGRVPEQWELLDEIDRLNNIISETSKDLQHELSHLKANDEVSWNEEFYTNDKLDYRKLCIALLEQFAKQLKEKE